MLAIVPNVLVVTSKFPASIVKEFIAYARANPVIPFTYHAVPDIA